MPTILLIGIPIVVVVLFIGIMNLPDEEMKTETKGEQPRKTEEKKKKRR